MEFSNDMERRNVKVPGDFVKLDAAGYKKKFGRDPINQEDLRAFQAGKLTRAELLQNLEK